MNKIIMILIIIIPLIVRDKPPPKKKFKECGKQVSLGKPNNGILGDFTDVEPFV